MTTAASAQAQSHSAQGSPQTSEPAFGDGWSKPMQKRERPTSQIALSFSSLLDNAFHMTNEIESLSTSVNRRQTSVQLSSLELQALEAKLKLLEEKEKRLSRGVAPTSPILPPDAGTTTSGATTGGAPSNDSTDQE